MNLVLTVVHGMEYERMAPFFESFVAFADANTKMHVFTCGVSRETVAKIESMGVVTHPFRYLSFRHRQPLLYLWPIWKPMMARRDFEGKCALGRKIFHLFAMRFIMYRDLLLQHPGEFENVLLTDCRDVFFQRDPFADRLGPGVHCFLEARTQIVGTCPSNRKMVEYTFGPEVIEEMARDRVSCAGTTMGDVTSIMGYLKAFVETISSGRKLYSVSDQGTHNYMIHYKRVPSLIVHDNYNSSVFTAGCEPEESIRWNERNEIIRDDGQSYPVLHQYDRFSSAREKLAVKLRAAARA